MKEENTAKKKHKIGVLDIVILVLVVAVIIFAVKFFGWSNETSVDASTRKISFTVELIAQPEEFADNAQIGQKVYDAEKGTYLGEVSAVDAHPHVAVPEADLDEGFKRASVVEGICDIDVVISAYAAVSPDETNVNGRLVAVGEMICIRTKTLAGEGYCIAVEN